jgi:hypothetical protein
VKQSNVLLYLERSQPIAWSHTMTTLMIEVPPETYAELSSIAKQTGRSAADLALAQLQQWLASLHSQPSREQALLREAGLVADPSPEMLQRAAQASMTLSEVRAALDRVGGKPLSEVIIEMRGPKV